MTGEPPSTSTPDVFAQFGFTPVEANGFRALWENPRAVYLLDDVASEVHIHGGTAEQAVDYAMHAVEQRDVSFLVTMGFTGHQAGLISQSEEATDKLHTKTWIKIAYAPISDVPRAYLVDLLRSPIPAVEVDELIDRYQEAVTGNPRTVNGTVDSIDYLTGNAVLLAMGEPSQDCTCR